MRSTKAPTYHELLECKKKAELLVDFAIGHPQLRRSTASVRVLLLVGRMLLFGKGKRFDRITIRQMSKGVPGLNRGTQLSPRVIQRALRTLEGLGAITSIEFLGDSRGYGYQVQWEVVQQTVDGWRQQTRRPGRECQGERCTGLPPQQSGLEDRYLESGKTTDSHDKFGNSGTAKPLVRRHSEEAAFVRSDSPPPERLPLERLRRAMAECVGTAPDLSFVHDVLNLAVGVGGDAESLAAFIRKRRARSFSSNGIWPKLVKEDYPKYLSEWTEHEGEDDRHSTSCEGDDGYGMAD